MKPIFLLLAILALGGVARPATASEQRPNIIIILVDDMGYGDPGCYNPQSKIATPNIDRLASEGMRFTDAHAPGPLCHPSRYGLITGQHPFRTDTSKWPKQPLIKKDQTTIASLLKTAGYRTTMVGKWHLGFEENGYDHVLPGGPVDRGFDSFFGFRASTDIPPYFYVRGDRAVTPPTNEIGDNNTEGWSAIQGAFWRGGGIAPDLQLKDVLPRLTDEAMKVIRDHAKEASTKPLMLYLALTAPHTPWLPSPEFQNRSQAGLYGDFAMMVDAMIGRVLLALDDTKLADNSIVIFTSDNGPVWYPEDVQRTGHDSLGGLRGMKNSHWEGGHRMPFIVRWPSKVQFGSTSDQLVCFTDVMATLAEVTGTKLPDDAGPDSISFLPALLGLKPKNLSMRNSLVIGKSIRSGPWKYIEGRESNLFMRQDSGTFPAKDEPAGQLYNLVDDLHETRNLINQEPGIVTKLKTEFTQIQTATRTRP
ncbi:MAG: arylsulfatase [Planctomycetota bacterium]|nr:arylsulfatase [Planctomycetota bacterium]